MERFDRADRTLSEWERRIRAGEELHLDETVDVMMDQLRELLRVLQIGHVSPEDMLRRFQEVRRGQQPCVCT